MGRARRGTAATDIDETNAMGQGERGIATVSGTGGGTIDGGTTDGRRTDGARIDDRRMRFGLSLYLQLV